MIKNSRSHANRGQSFEEFLRFVHARYQVNGKACMYKVPTEFIPLRDKTGKVSSVKVEHKSCVDYLGRYKGTPVAVEAKHTEDRRISFDRIEPHQAEYLNDFCKNEEAIGIVLVSFALRNFYAIPWVFWKAAQDDWEQSKGKSPATVTAYGWTWTTPGMASACQEQLHPEWEVKTGGTMGLPYLEIIDRMIGGSKFV